MKLKNHLVHSNKNVQAACWHQKQIIAMSIASNHDDMASPRNDFEHQDQKSSMAAGCGFSKGRAVNSRRPIGSTSGQSSEGWLPQPPLGTGRKLFGSKTNLF